MADGAFVHRNNVLIAGHYGDRNLGDDAIAQVLVRGVSARDEIARIWILTLRDRPDIGCWGEKVSSLQLNRLGGVIALLKLIPRTRWMLVGGGGILQDVTSLGNVLLHTVFPLVLSFLAIQVHVVGVGVGPIQRKLSRLLVGSLLRRAKTILVRDPESKQLCLELGAPSSATVVCPDLAWAWTSAVPGHAAAPRRIFLSVRPPVGAKRERDEPSIQYLHLLANLAEVIHRVAKQRGLVFGFLGTHPQQDGLLIEQVKSQVSNPNDVKVLLPRDVERLCGIFEPGDILVGMRLHANIIAMSKGVPCIALSYDPKVRRNLNGLELEGMTFDFPPSAQALQELAETLRQVCDQYSDVSARVGALAAAKRSSASGALDSMIANYE